MIFVFPILNTEKIILKDAHIHFSLPGCYKKCAWYVGGNVMGEEIIKRELSVRNPDPRGKQAKLNRRLPIYNLSYY